MLKYFFNISHLPIAVYEEEILVTELAVRRFEPNPAVWYLKELLDDGNEKLMDLTIGKNNIISGFIRDREGQYTIIIGPVLEFPCTKKTAFAILKDMGEPLNRAEELMDYFSRIPGMPLITFYKNLSFLNYTINEEEPVDDYMDKKAEDLLGPETDLEKQERHHLHTAGDAEFQLLSCVEFGKIEELDTLMRKRLPKEAHMGRAAKDSIHSIRNIMIASIAVIARQAAKGGMDYDEAIEMSDAYLQKLDVLDNYDEILGVWGQAVYEYTAIVNKIRSLNPDSELIRRINSYIQNHIYGKVTVDDIAVYTGKSLSYLCREFKAETGKTMRDYINEVKVEEAKRLLAYSDKEIVGIAIELGYTSQAYFTTVFKNKTGMTPAQYRKMVV